MKSIIVLNLLFLASVLVAQPSTEVYLFDLQKDAQNNYSIQNPVNVSNNEGYDNQPSFWSDGNSILYARNVDGQTEIARYFIGSGKTNLISKTPQGGEYSPTLMPDGRISSIRLDTTGFQRLYVYDLNGENEVLVDELVIGYHVWLDKTKLAAFVLGEPSTLQLIDTKSGKSKIMAEKIGRSLHQVPNTKLMSYVDKSGDQWIIKVLNVKKGEKTELVSTLDGAEDYCWTPSSEIIMGQGNDLWIWNYAVGWKKFFDISSFGLQGITRVAVSPEGDKLALVVNK